MPANFCVCPTAGRSRAGSWSAWLLLAALPFTAHAAEPGTPIPAGSLLAPQTHFEFAIYYPGDAPADPLPRLRALAAATTGAPRLVGKMPDAPAEPLLVARLDRGAQSDYAPPEPEMLSRFGYGLSQADADAIMNSHTALILDFAHPSARALPVLHTVSVLVERLARETHGFIWDETTRETLSPDAWHTRRVLSWTGDVPQVGMHTVVHAYDDGGALRAITLGMGKFGLPDVVLPHFSGALIAPMGFLFDMTTQAMVEGAQPAQAGQLDVDLRLIRNQQSRALMQARLKPGAPPARLVVVVGRAEDGDPRNRLMEIAPARYAGADAAQRLAALSHSLFDAEDDLRRVQHTDELLAASEAARAKLPALREAFARGLLPGESIDVKAPFKTDGGGREWMWVRVEKWKGDAVEGMLANEPDRIATLHSGQHVVVSQADLFDFLHRFPDGHVEGDETDAIIERLDKARGH
jgi:uncharacterized protein YegJ (DUF2314 family)